MTPKELDEIKVACERTTPGPWNWETYSDEPSLSTVGDPEEGHILTCHVCDACRRRNQRCLAPNEDDALFIAKAREWIPALIAEIEALQRAAK